MKIVHRTTSIGNTFPKRGDSVLNFLDIELLALVLSSMNTANFQHTRTSSQKVHAHKAWTVLCLLCVLVTWR